MDLISACHKLTVKEVKGTGEALDKFEYQHLIWGILVVVNLIITKKHLQIVLLYSILIKYATYLARFFVCKKILFYTRPV